MLENDSDMEKQTEKEYDNDLALLRNWYQLDENSVPVCYKLQKIRSVKHLKYMQQSLEINLRTLNMIDI